MKIPATHHNYDFTLAKYVKEDHKGIAYYSIKDDTTNLIKLELVFLNGMKYQGKSFSARILEDLITEGTQKFPGKSFLEKIDELGGYISVDTSRDYFTLELVLMKDFEKDLLEIITELIYNVDFSLDAFKRSINQAKISYDLAYSRSSTIATKILMQNLFKDHYYGIYADKEDLDELSIADIEKHYKQLKNSLLYVFLGGNISSNLTKSLKEVLTNNNLVFKTLKPQKHKRNVITYDSGKFEQDTLRVGAVLDISVDNIAEVQLSNLIFGGYFGSKLNKLIREEKGWSYGINSSVIYLSDACYFLIGSDLKKGTFNATIESINIEYDKLKSKPLKKEEVNHAVNFLMGAMLKNLDGVFEQLSELKSSILLGRNHVDYYENIKTNLKAATPETVQKSFQKYYNQENWISVLVK